MLWYQVRRSGVDFDNDLERFVVHSVGFGVGDQAGLGFFSPIAGAGVASLRDM